MARAATALQGEGESAPEADRLGDFPHPREITTFFGHEAAASQLQSAFDGGKMPHAWLFTGPEGIGKATLAYAFTRYVLSYGSLEDLSERSSFKQSPGGPVAAQIRRLSHPNLLVLRRGWNAKDKRFFSAILVDDVRRLQSFFGLTAGEKTWRIVIVDRADELNENAANALLKLLEEPPAQSLFLLVSSAPGNVLTTIRSRCRRLDLAPLRAAEIVVAVQNACQQAEFDAPTGDALQRLTLLSEGSVRRALELSSGRGLALYEKLLAIFQNLPKMNLAEADQFAEQLGPVSAQGDYQMFFSLFEDMVHRLVRHAAKGESPIGEEAEIAKRLLNGQNLAKWAELWETVARARRQAQALNLDRKILIIETLQNLTKTASAK